MITLTPSKASLAAFQTELDLKVGGIHELTHPEILQELGNAIFTVGSKAFVKAMNLEAKVNPKKYHHIYEWKKIGTTTGKLFFLYKEYSVNGKVVVRPGFRESRTRVPVDPALLTPGKTGKSVASRHIFRDKASVMETGKPVIYRASKPLPITNNGQVRFIAAGTLIRNYQPGGKEVKGSFEKYYNYWFATKLDNIINATGIIGKMENQVALTLNAKNGGPDQVRTSVINLLRQYSKDEVVI